MNNVSSHWFVMLLIAALCAPAALRAQDTPPPADVPAPPAETARDAPPRDFKPSQEVSPDQEVDFPADI